MAGQKAAKSEWPITRPSFTNFANFLSPPNSRAASQVSSIYPISMHRYAMLYTTSVTYDRESSSRSSLSFFFSPLKNRYISLLFSSPSSFLPYPPPVNLTESYGSMLEEEKKKMSSCRRNFVFISECVSCLWNLKEIRCVRVVRRGLSNEYLMCDYISILINYNVNFQLGFNFYV